MLTFMLELVRDCLVINQKHINKNIILIGQFIIFSAKKSSTREFIEVENFSLRQSLNVH